MKKIIATLLASSVGLALFAAASEPEDEQLFLIPHLQSGVSQLTDHLVLNTGCGTGAWAKALADKGARVCACDSKKESLSQVQMAIAMAGAEHKISLQEGNPVALPYQDAFFDGAISVGIGNELPRVIHRLEGDRFYVGGLELHMHELARVLKEGAVATIVAPASYEIVFTDHSTSPEMTLRHIDAVLAKLDANPQPAQIQAALAELAEVNRATFVQRGERLRLVTEASDLCPGERIWRKESERVHPAFYHVEEEYLVALANAGLKCTEVKRPCFFGKVKYRSYQQSKGEGSQLGLSYVDHNPFTIYTVVKEN